MLNQTSLRNDDDYRANVTSTAWRGVRFKTLCCALLAASLHLLPASVVNAQYRPWHNRHTVDLPLGAVGREQLTRGGPLPGYFQPVTILAPKGASISFAVNGQFQAPQQAPATAGMLIGQVYRVKVTGIPFNEGLEVFPSIEVINRLYPPRGLEARYPIPIHLTQEELEIALSGRYVTRVVYLEDPDAALPRAEAPDFQRYFEVLPAQDPLTVADRLGRPMAILRLGSRIPDSVGVTDEFVHGSPPFVSFNQPPRDPAAGEAPAENVAPPQPEGGPPQATNTNDFPAPSSRRNVRQAGFDGAADEPAAEDSLPAPEEYRRDLPFQPDSIEDGSAQPRDERDPR